MITANVLIAFIACATVVYLGTLFYRFTVSKASEAVGLLMGDVELLKAGYETLENRSEAHETAIKDLKRAATNTNIGKIR